MTTSADSQLQQHRTTDSTPPTKAPSITTATQPANETMVVSFRGDFRRIAASPASIEAFSAALRAGIFALPISNITSSSITAIVLADGGEYTIAYITFNTALLAAEVTLAVLQGLLVVHYDESTYDGIDGRVVEFPSHVPIIAAVLPGIFILTIIVVAFGMFHARRRRRIQAQHDETNMMGTEPSSIYLTADGMSVLRMNPLECPSSQLLHDAVAANQLEDVR